MEQKHQDLIKLNYTTLVRKMTSSTVAGHLFAANIITDEMRQQIEAEKKKLRSEQKTPYYHSSERTKSFQRSPNGADESRSNRFIQASH